MLDVRSTLFCSCVVCVVEWHVLRYVRLRSLEFVLPRFFLLGWYVSAFSCVCRASLGVVRGVAQRRKIKDDGNGVRVVAIDLVTKGIFSPSVFLLHFGFLMLT